MTLDKTDTSKRFEATVLATSRLTAAGSLEEVRELELDVAAPGMKLDVGQSVGVFAPTDGTFGQDYHLRLYSVADLPSTGKDGHPRIKIAVRRCSYVDEYSGERYQGVASNYLCDRKEGDTITLAGPFGLPFQVPDRLDANLILIATSTGIAPFRAFVRHLYERTRFVGQIRLFYGVQSGLDAIYLNDQRDDFAQYYDNETFDAILALSPRPHFGDPIDFGSSIVERGEELWKMLGESKTYVYIAGLESVRANLYSVFEKVAGSREKFERRRAELTAGERWVELLY